VTAQDSFVHFDGAYVLGALDPADRAAFEAHLATCPECRARVDEVAGTAALLGGLTDAEVLSEPASMPDTLLPGLLRKANQERTRRRWLTTGLATVAAACLIALVTVLWPSTNSAGAPARELQAVQASPVHATAALVAHRWGTEIDLYCRYDGIVPAVPYRLVVIDKSNKSYDAGSWTLVPGGVTNFSGGTEVPRDQIAKVQITLPNGKPILQLTT
jgi:hypothetical protein